MWYEIFKFEIKYRFRRPETYLFFVFLMAFSIFGVDFIFQGVETGLMKMNAPIVLGKTMGAITGIFMILASMIMGMPMIRDDQYQITPLIYTCPIKKKDLLLGRFLGSFLILLLIFSGIPLGMMIGEFLPWHLESEMLPFQFSTYLYTFSSIVLPTLFFGAAVFFVTGTLSRNLLVVYTQGIFIFVVFLLTKSITNEYAQAILDPFSLTTITNLTKEWEIAQRNVSLLPFSGVLLVNKLFWVFVGVFVMIFGYFRFSVTTFTNAKKTSSKRSRKVNVAKQSTRNLDVILPQVTVDDGWNAKWKQFISMSIFYGKSLMKETSFWAIVICGAIIILINSISLGTVYGVDSYPTTYFIVEELQELSMYFFIIILLFYSGELFWKEKSVRMHFLRDANPISSLIILCSKMAGLVGVYIVLILSLMFSGILFQITKGYYHFDLPVYFGGFFIEILPLLLIYTFVAFFIQSLVNNKFLGIILTLFFIIVMVVLEVMGYDHILFNFGGGGLKSYSEMNGYGHFMTTYLWTKAYWISFGMLLLIGASLIAGRGADIGWINRFKQVGSVFSKKAKTLTIIIFLIFVSIGSFNFYQANILNEHWTSKQENDYRASYEKELKQFEYLPQPKISDAKMYMDLFPEERAYVLKGSYMMINEEDEPIKEIHVQKMLESGVALDSIHFSAETLIDSQYHKYAYYIFSLETPLEPGDSIVMKFDQSYTSQGFNITSSAGSVLNNGTFIRNNEFPTLGYQDKIELKDETDRKTYGLAPKESKAEIDDHQELQRSRSGSDSKGMTLDFTIGTSAYQTAITSGELVKQWKEGARNYFQYRSKQPIIDFYAVSSGNYELLQDSWSSSDGETTSPVLLEIYHHPRHDYNLDRMMAGMKASLDYYSVHFAPYQYQQLRIVEFPRYESFAQSFPNTIPFSESIGFMLDIDDEEDVDMTFFVTAHEVAHQWWGMQLESANVKGRNFILETLSQYAALMVFRKQYAQEKVDQLLELQRELYDKKRKQASEAEVPLNLVGNEEYIYYNKGILAMFELQEMIGEDRVNCALKAFIHDWNSESGEVKWEKMRYATSADLIDYILDETPEKDRNEVLNLLTKVKR
ncbi:M1 family aminopeptidase [Portibacter lacus]|uniref:Peptidase M1 membrane alanine aminopeptidase domain-containing protein n=1 Tax=Portibacter lacus TaxID=1099794 RepID=A0AA37WEK3_9BACT|nr:M1 family aminopeptidase [Portibacter lacus]GLR16829.1 hypothetical protein GCM10007940_14440 [Portibacter lacus]